MVNCDKAKQELKHQSTVSLDEGVELTIDWMREFYNLNEEEMDNFKNDYPKINWY